MTSMALAPRTALFLPASNPRAIAKARTLDCDMVILDLEDAVKPEDKDAAREAAAAAATEGFGERIAAIRVNGVDAAEHGADLAAAARSAADLVVVPKVEDAASAARIAATLGKPLLAMIETPAGVLAAAAIAAQPCVAGLIAGTNDLKASLGIPSAAGRGGLSLALQTVVLAARAGNGWALDGVFNALADGEGLAAECREGRALGFDGKTLIHPGQIAIAAEAFGATADEIADARALLAAAQGGAERFRDRMIEAMHVAQARLLLQRAGETE
ncbi:CoA ester lyase [Sphingomonas sp. ABOLD]|uniref:Citrate lyase subunit beta/citryl-CoA lyase n=1 Tax=Sphingomonas trueperi TaxID=53317 RepID=A0A7X5XXE7_9SPHN|nr:MULTISPECIES: CoA ester lyase [Sphingomonas]NJB97119.1 citrate lyase subunit beta/citryl-CoA lyase [Sphingomonas trueperi]RSV49385.1 CoA ester lyase [Sphingomonas sp. ABOLD]